MDYAHVTVYMAQYTIKPLRLLVCIASISAEHRHICGFTQAGKLFLYWENHGGPEVQNTTANQKTRQQKRNDNSKSETTTTLTKTEKVGTLG